MSKKNINKRLEHIFDDVNKEDAKPRRQVKKPALGTGLLTLPKAPAVSRTRTRQPKSLALRSEDTTPSSPAITDASGTMSLAFRRDANSWATLRVVDETASHAWAKEEQLLVKQVADQLSLALENARLFQRQARRSGAQTPERIPCSGCRDRPACHIHSGPEYDIQPHGQSGA